jgi:hypothetical protein
MGRIFFSASVGDCCWVVKGRLLSDAKQVLARGESGSQAAPAW